MLLFWRRSNAPKCKPFTVYKVDCNHCVCAADGTTSCTRMDCRYLKTKRKPKLRTKKPVYYIDESDDTDDSVQSK
ncbi:uncharacterized protein LOC133524915 isoform X2 [Cydia pomonella]|nr:uncharacterized protein LOC133524915 isoform X2 [Cydia pomonella]